MSLLFPAYLAGLLGLALPWLLHRFSDQQAEEQAFPSGRFLEPTTPPVSRTRQLKYRVLLVLRVLSLLLLCCLFAQPWIVRQDAASVARTHHLVAVDQSLSMRATGRWQAAGDEAEAIIDALPKTDTVQLVGFDRSVHPFANDGDSVAVQRRALRSAEAHYLMSDYGRAMQALNGLAAREKRPVKLWLISDMQQSALPTQLNALYAPQISEVVLKSVVSDSQRNLSLSASAQSSDGVNLHITAQVRASESSFASDEVLLPRTDLLTPVTVQVAFEGRVLAEQRISVKVGDLETLVFDGLTLPDSRDAVFLVSIVATDARQDTLSDDNSVQVTVEEADPTPVVLLKSERLESDNASVFLATALETDQLSRAIPLSGTIERVPAETQHLITSRPLAASVDTTVLQFVDTGANVLVFRSDEGSDIGHEQVSGREVGVLDDAHPLSLNQLDWRGVRFYDVPELRLEEGDRVLLETDQGKAILVERSTERGRLLLLNDRLDGLSSNLPLQPVFVALMQSILHYFDASTSLPDQLVVGSRLTLPAQVQVLDPENNPLLTLDASAHSGAIELNEPGLYTVIGTRGEHALQLVLDPRETDLSSIETEALDAWQARYVGGRSQLSEGSVVPKDADIHVADSLQIARNNEASRLAVWRVLLPLLALLLLLECGFANRRLDVRRDGS